MFVFPKPKSIEHLQPNWPQAENSRLVDRRKKVDIVVVDDEPFAPASNLANHGFVLQYMADVSSIKQIEAYPVVLCDLQGVGMQLSKSKQGAHIIKEIRKSYPEKIVIAYTGGSANAAITRAALSDAHFFLPKDERVEKWVETLDLAIGQAIDPIRVWRTTRVGLLESGATPYQLMLLEDAYVRGIPLGMQATKNGLETLMNSQKLLPSVKGLLENLVASAALKVFFGL